MGTDVLAPKYGGIVPYQDVYPIALDSQPWQEGGVLGDIPFHYERSVAGPGARLWLRAGVRAGDVEVAVAYATRFSLLQFGPKGMVTVFAKDDSTVSFQDLPSVENVIYHEPFARLASPIHHDPSITLIPVPAIRPSFPKAPFRYQADAPKPPE